MLNYKIPLTGAKSAILLACEEGNLNVLKKLTADKEMTSEENEAFLLACSEGFAQIVEYLLTRMDKNNDVLGNGLELAIKNNHMETIYVLFDSDIPLNLEIVNQLADFALAHEDLKFLDEINYKSNIFKDANFPKLAVRYGRVATIIHLHNKGVQFNFKDSELFQAFLRQCQFEADTWPVLKHFLKNGADMTAVENSAFMESLERAENDKAVQYLLDHGYSADF